MNEKNQKKILVIHTKYQFFGGEDSVVAQEVELLKTHYKVETIFFQNHSGLLGAIQFLFSIWNIWSSILVKKKLKQFQPDIVHVHNWHFASGPLIFRTINKLKVPVILTLHNYRLLCPSATLLNKRKLFLHSLSQNFPFKAIQQQVYRNSWVQTFWLAFVVWFHNKIGTWQIINKYICLTQNSIDLFKNSKLDIPNKSFIIKPNFTLRDNITKNTETEKNSFLFIGRLSEEKGINVLLESFYKLPYKLKIVGEGPLKSKVIQAVKHNSNIEYLGTLNKKDINLELQKTEALIFPSIWNETFGMVIIEAFSNKCAVISSNIGAPLSIIKNNKNGIHFKYGNSNDLIRIIHKWMKLSLNEKDKIRNNAYDSFEKLYSKQRQKQYFRLIINNILKDNSQ